VANGELTSTLLEDVDFRDFLGFTDVLDFPDDFLGFTDVLVFRDDLPLAACWHLSSSSTKLSSMMSSWCHPS
jgi:hypothetical protein